MELLQPFSVADFRLGLGLGLIALVTLLGAVTHFRRDGRSEPLPWGGVAIAAGALLAVERHRGVPGAVLVGVAGVATVTWWVERHGRPGWVTVIGAAPFAGLVATRGALLDVDWVQGLVAAEIAVGAALVGRTDRDRQAVAVGPGLFLISAAGVYVTVPDVHEAAALLGVATFVGVLGWPFRLVRLGPAGAGAVVAVLAWVAGRGGIGRPASIVGAAACLGLLAGLGAARALAPDDDDGAERSDQAGPVVALGVAHLGIVAVASRVAGLRHDVVEASVYAACCGAASVVAGALFVSARPRRRVTGGRR